MSMSGPFSSRAAFLDDWRGEVQRLGRLSSPDKWLDKPAASRLRDQRNLKLAWDHLSNHGGDAAGPDGKTFSDFTRVASWKQIQRLQQILDTNTYQHGPVRTVRVSKEPFSRGTRKLSIGNIEDRVVSRAIAQILEPVLGMQFDPRSFCRGGLGATYALAHAKAMAEQQNRWTWITQDIQEAFDHVTLAKLLEVIKTYVASDRLIDIIRRSIGTDRKQGLSQGSPLSPVLMNLFLHHYIDLPWRKRHPSIPLLRYMDDLVLLGNTTDVLPQLQRDLAILADEAGLKLKYEARLAEHKLEHQGVSWLGYHLRQGPAGLEIKLPFDREIPGAVKYRKYIQARFRKLHELPDAPAAARQLIMGVIAWAGPAYLTSNRNQIYVFLRQVAREAAFEEVPSLARIQTHWKRAHGRWLKACQREREDRLGTGPRHEEWESDDCGEAPF